MIMWCKRCETPMEYRDACGLKWPHYTSVDDRPTCGKCSLGSMYEDGEWIFCPLCGDSIRADPNPLVNRVRAWSWRRAHRLNCLGDAS